MIALRRFAHGEGLALPARQSASAAGYDLCAAVDPHQPLVIGPGLFEAVPCGFAMALPQGYEAQVRPRSGLAARHGVTVLNAPGTIDADYRGEVKVILINHGRAPFEVHRGDRIAQMVLAKVEALDFVAADTLEATARGAGGFGSTGR